jgi:DNA-binding LacI/PurR family transcriptional regulator
MALKTSKSIELRSHLLEEMVKDRIPAGGQLPSEHELGQRFSVSRTTVRHALNQLCVEGLIERRQGKGSFRSLRPVSPRLRSRSTLVGVWANWPGGPFFGAIAEGIRDELNHRGYHAVFESGGYQNGDEDRGIRALIQKGLDGFIVAPSTEGLGDSHDLLAALIKRGLAVVLVDQRVPGCECDLATTHQRLGAQEVMNHLIELGHRRIAFVGLRGPSTIEDRLGGYHGTMREHGLTPDPAWVQFADSANRDTGRQGARALFALPRERRPTAIFGANDWIAMSVAMVAREQGLRVPEDVSIAGFDGIQLHVGREAPLFVRERPFASLSPETFGFAEAGWLTTYVQPTHEIGRQAATLLLERIEHPNRPVLHVLLSGKLTKGNSTAPPQTGNEEISGGEPARLAAGLGSSTRTAGQAGEWSEVDR